MYDNSDLQLTDLERQILELRSRDKAVEVVGETGKLIESSDVSWALLLIKRACDKRLPGWKAAHVRLRMRLPNDTYSCSVLQSPVFDSESSSSFTAAAG